MGQKRKRVWKIKKKAHFNWTNGNLCGVKKKADFNVEKERKKKCAVLNADFDGKTLTMHKLSVVPLKSALYLTFCVFGSCFRTLALTLF